MGATHAVQEGRPAHAGVDRDRHGAEFEQREHPYDQVVTRTYRQQHAVPGGEAGLGEVRGGRVALLVELSEGAGLVTDFTRRADADRRLRGQTFRTVGSRDPEMAGDIASGDVHGL